jgi:hypothetical protein
MNIQSVEDIAVASQERRPVLAVRHGRGRTGGSTFMDLLIQRARAANRLVSLAVSMMRRRWLGSAESAFAGWLPSLSILFFWTA